MTFLELAETIIKQAGVALSVSEIWDKAEELGLIQQLNSKGKTPKNTLASQLYTAAQQQQNQFEVVGKNPNRFGLKNVTPHAQIALSTLKPTKSEKFTERDLHPLLVKFVDSHYHFRGAKLKTIFHENSIKAKKGANKWLHPDLVGVYFSFHDKLRKYEGIIIDFQQYFSMVGFKLFSFELKINLNFANLRESYFQAVSNSSWGNEGYLVALKIDEEIIEEARRLANSFGIGLIQLDAEHVADGQILVPATYKHQLDIDAMDRLATENKDFADFLKNMIDDNKVKKVHSPYDKIMEDTEFEAYLKDKGVLKK